MSLIRNFVKHFDALPMSDIALSCQLFERWDHRQTETLQLPQEFVSKLEPRIMSYVDSGEFENEPNARAIAVNLVTGVHQSKLGSDALWDRLETMIVSGLKKEY